MRIPAGRGLEQLWAKTGKAGKAVVVLALVGGVWVWTVLGADPPPIQPVAPRQAAIPEIRTQKAQTASDWLTIQEKNVELANKQRADQQHIAALEQRFVAFERDQKTQEAQRQQQADVKLRQALDAQAAQIAQMLQAQQAKATSPPATKAPVPSRPPATVVQAAAPPATKPRGILAIDKNTDKDWPGGATPLPDAARAETAYLPAASFAAIQLTDGVFANSRKGGALPIAVAIKGHFQGPYHLHGPGQAPTLTRVHLEGCAMLGRAEADLGSGRVNMTFDLLSCVFPEKDAFERPIKAHVIGQDGSLGLPGRWETRETAYLARMALTSAMAGLADAFALANRTVIVTPFGGTTSTLNENVGQTAGLSALSRAAADASKFYLEQAERLMPVLWAESGLRGSVRLQEGLSLDGYPTQMLVSQGDLP